MGLALNFHLYIYICCSPEKYKHYRHQTIFYGYFCLETQFLTLVFEFSAMKDFGEEELIEPVSPLGQCLDSTFLCMHIIAVLEFEVPIHDLQTLPMVKDSFLSIPRFTSIMVLSSSSLQNICKFL